MKTVKKLKTPEKAAIVKSHRKSGSIRKKISKNSFIEKKRVMTPCEMKRLMSGADYKTEYDFNETEQKMYSHRRSGYKVCLTELLVDKLHQAILFHITVMNSNSFLKL